MTPLIGSMSPARRLVPQDAWRGALARLLRSASAALSRRARALDRPLLARRRRTRPEPFYEFHAEAGAPEGALFVDGEFIGTIEARRL